MKRLTPRLRAFTLIELLIVITIIGILAVALIPRLTGGPARARDAQRKADLQTFATALEFYANDNGGYPAASGCASDLFISTGSAPLTGYLTTLPADPSELGASGVLSACDHDYTYFALDTANGGNAEGYLLLADLENESDRGPSGVYETFTVDDGVTAATNFTNNEANLCSDATCTSTNVFYMVGR